jgi:hypothetical protein
MLALLAYTIRQSDKYQYRRNSLVRASAAGANRIQGGNMIKLFSTKKLMTVLMFLSTVALGALVAQAQIASVKVDIPFAFTVEHTTLPAGHYEIAMSTDIEHSMDMRNPQKDVNILLVAETERGLMNPAKPELVFDRIGNKDFLREVNTGDFVYTLLKSPMEAKLEKQGQKSESHGVPCSSMGKTTKTAKASAY